MSLLKITIGLALVIVGIVLMYQGPFNNALGPIDELITKPEYLMGTIFLPIVFLVSGGILIKQN